MKIRKILALLLVLTMCLSLFPSFAFADNEDDTVVPTESTVPEEDPVENPVENPVDDPVDDPEEEPVENPVENPVDDPEEEPEEEPEEKSEEESGEDSDTDSGEEPEEEPEEPAEEPEEIVEDSAGVRGLEIALDGTNEVIEETFVVPKGEKKDISFGAVGTFAYTAEDDLPGTFTLTEGTYVPGTSSLADSHLNTLPWAWDSTTNLYSELYTAGSEGNGYYKGSEWSTSDIPSINNGVQGRFAMKIKEGFVMTEVAGETMVVPVGDAASILHGIIRLNNTGRDIWKGFAEGLSEEQIAERLVEEYEGVDLAIAQSGIRKMIEQLRAAGILEE